MELKLEGEGKEGDKQRKKERSGFEKEKRIVAGLPRLQVKPAREHKPQLSVASLKLLLASSLLTPALNC